MGKSLEITRRISCYSLISEWIFEYLHHVAARLLNGIIASVHPTNPRGRAGDPDVGGDGHAVTDPDAGLVGLPAAGAKATRGISLKTWLYADLWD